MTESANPNLEQVKMPKAKKMNSKKPDNRNEKTAPRLITMAQAAEHCKTSLNNFRYHAAKYPDFPVEEKNGGNKGWKIDIDKLDAFRKKYGFLLEKIETGPTTTAQDRAAAQTKLLNMQIEERQGNLIQRDWIQREMNAVFIALSKELDILIDSVCKDLGIEQKVIDILNKRLDAARDAMVLRLRALKALPVS